MIKKFDENLDFNVYPEGHWNTLKDSEKALKEYLEINEDVYCKNNINNILLEVELVSKSKKLKILDFGGGIGILSVSLAKMGHSVTLLESSKTALKTSSYYANLEGQNIELVHLQNLENLEKESFDCIVLKDVIEHIVDDESLLNKLYLLLKLNGSLLMSTQNNFSANYVIEGILRKLQNPFKKWLGWDPTHVRWYNYISLKRLASSAGFSVTKYNSSYIVPYKLILKVFPWIDSTKDNMIYRLDKYLQKIKIFNKTGWNILAVCQKKAK